MQLFPLQSVAVGYTPLSDGSQYYNTWYSVALKVRELDTLGEICFAVVTSEELALDLGVEAVPSARLMMWNGTKVINILLILVQYHRQIFPSHTNLVQT